MNFWMKMLLGGANFAIADEGGAGAGDGGAGGGADGVKPGAGDGVDKAGQEGGGDKSGEAANGGAGDGADGDKQAAGEFVADPAKTPEENEAAKTAHDAKVEADKANAEMFGAPEKYADLVIPEGLQLDQTAADGFFTLGKKLNLSQATVDQIIDIQKGIYERQAVDGANAWAETVKTWTNEVKADKAIGGAAYEKNMGKAAAARETFGTPELNAWLDETQLGSHPEMVRFLVTVGNAMGEGSTAKGGAVNHEVDAGELLYDHPSSKL